MSDRRFPRVSAVVRWLTVFAFTLVGVVTLIGNRIQAAGNDAVFTQSLVNRAARFGGSYYDNGITPKGPLEDVVHDVALRIGGYDGHFYVISIMIVLSASLIGLAAARTARTTGANGYVALAAAAAVFLHFTLSSAAYSGLLYSRNLLVTLFAAAWLLTIEDRVWTGSPRRQWMAAAATGALLGLGVQTILPAFIDAIAIGTAAALLLKQRVGDRARRAFLRLVTGVAAILAFVSAPLWYFARGGFASFWASWWTYASYQYRGIGLSLGQELSRGGNNFYGYYRHRPVLFVMIAVFVCITITEWLRFDRKLRIVHLALLGWFAGGWFQLVSGERYSTHYFSVIAAPTTMIGAALAGHAYAAVSARWRVSQATTVLPLLVIVLTFVFSSGTTSRLITAASITSGFTSVHRQVQLDRADQPGPNQSVQAVLDLVSHDLDPLLAYSDDQFIYPLYRRIPATRFQQRYFLIGSIYLGQTGPQYILHNTWKWFDEDLRQSNPVAFLKTEPIDSEPFAQFVSTRFKTVFSGSAGTVELRNDVAKSVLDRVSPDAWTAPVAPGPASGWVLDGSSADYARAGAPMSLDRLTLTTRACERIDGRLDAGPHTAPMVVFHVKDARRHDPELRISFDGAYANVQDAHGGFLDEIPAGPHTSAGTPLTGPVPFSFVIGRRSAALVIENQIVAAVAVPDHVEVTVEPGAQHLLLAELSVGAPPIGSGC